MPYIIPFFLPQLGCPHQCLFCNQHHITGQKSHGNLGELNVAINATLDQWLQRSSNHSRRQFAFFGGSFTCLPLTLQKALLEKVQPWIKRGEIDSIRLSTRPDCLDEEVVEMLVACGVGTVELGVQSLDDRVLLAARRGHDATSCVQAVELLRRAGMETGVQLMPGLPQESRYSFIRTVKKAIALQPSFIRLYPALVVDHSGLAEMYRKGDYTPLSLDMAVILCKFARERFRAASIPVVRMGLQASDSLHQSLIAGPYHPAFGELVLSRHWLKKTRAIMAAHPQANVQITISSRDLSAFTGMARKNIERLAELGMLERLQLNTDKKMERGLISYVVG